MQRATITLQGLELNVFLGWSEEERQQRQSISTQIHIQFPEPPAACNTDDLADTLCYDALVSTIKTNIENRQFKLLEHLAKEIYQIIKSCRMAADIKVNVTKKPPIPNLTQGVTLSYGDGHVTW